MNEWYQKAPEYLSKIMMHECIGQVSPCRCLNGQDALYKCLTCIFPTLLCGSCIAKTHMSSPLHRLVHWNGRHFDNVDQSSVGVHISVPHANGSLCSNPTSVGSVTIVDLNGFHELNIEFCGCEHAAALDIQLLSVQLFAASAISPKTAFSFQLLEQFRVLHLEGKTSAHTFVNALVRLTLGDNFGAKQVKVKLIPALRS